LRDRIKALAVSLSIVRVCILSEDVHILSLI
jgi:hypothetical protein